MNTLNSPQRSQRRGIRYPLQLPVSVKLSHKEMHTQSENISLGGILLSSAFLIPEGATVEVAVGIAHLPEPGTQLKARGKVLRVLPKASGDFDLAIAFERNFELDLQVLDPGPNSARQERAPRFPQTRNSVIVRRLAAAWHMET